MKRTALSVVAIAIGMAAFVATSYPALAGIVRHGPSKPHLQTARSFSTAAAVSDARRRGLACDGSSKDPAYLK
jgi:hypothetical protein